MDHPAPGLSATSYGPDLSTIFADVGCVGAVAALRLSDGALVGVGQDERVVPASVMKVQIALSALDAMSSGRLDGSSVLHLAASTRTSGPVGISLLRDDVDMSLRDLITLMLTISDNAATDAVLAATGLDAVNDLTHRLGLEVTCVRSDLRTMLDAMAREIGYLDYAHLAGSTSPPDGMSVPELRRRLAGSGALDPGRGSCTTPRETVTLLAAVWDDTAAAPDACRGVRTAMAQQLTRHRIASGFGPGVEVAAKSGGLLGIVRNEAGVVTLPDGRSYAVAVFTRSSPDRPTDPRAVDAAIGTAAARAVAVLSA